MRTLISSALLPLSVLGFACAETPEPALPNADAARIDSLNARLVQVYRSHNPQEYGALFTDSAVFEWPAFNTVHGRAALEEMVRANWASLSEQDLQLIISSRRLAPNHVTEFGAFQQSYTDPKGARLSEFGRYVTVLARQADGTWLIDRFFGFADSTRPVSPRP